MWLKTAIKNLSLLLVSLIIALFVTEGIFRLAPLLRQRYAYKMFVTRFSPITWLGQEDSSHIYRPSDLLGYERIPNSAPNINSYGLIGEEFSIEKPKDVFRILILGNSIAAQNYFVEILKEKFNNLPIETKFELINAGVGGYQLWHYARFLKYRGIKFNPDMVLISFAGDDASVNRHTYYKTEKGFEVFSIASPRVLNKIMFNMTLFRRSYVYRIFVIASENIIARKNQYTPQKESNHHLSTIKKICKDSNIPLFGFIWPWLSSMDIDIDPTQESKVLKILVKGLEDVDIDYIDLDKVFPRQGREFLREWKNDPVHPSREGHRIGAQAIFKYLVENYSQYFIPSYER